MSDIRNRARAIIDAIPDKEIRSNDGSGLYTKYTGLTQAGLESNWKSGGQLTGCNEFVGWYGRQLSAPQNLGIFTLEKELPKWGKGDAWVKASSGRRPKFGDILLHAPFDKKGKPQLHLDVALDFDGDSLLRIQAGYGGRSKGYDAIRRISDEYAPEYFQGWLDLDRFFGPAISTAPTPQWLSGWWSVQDKGQYYYYFGPYGYIHCTKVKPVSVLPPFKAKDNEGEFSVLANTLLIDWGDDDISVIEKFTNVKPGAKIMDGTSTTGSRMNATKMF